MRPYSDFKIIGHPQKMMNSSSLPKIELDKTVEMQSGTGIYFPPGSVHSASHPNAPASWIRLTGQDLGKLPRQIWDEKTGLKV